MLFVDMSAVKLPGEAKQNNLPPECGQQIDVGEFGISHFLYVFCLCHEKYYNPRD
jgi:hypothetical protein